VGTPRDHWRFRAAEHAQVPPRYTLEVHGGRLVGDFGATVTTGGVLDYQTSGYFGITGWREHPLFLKPTLGRIEHVPGTVLSLTARGTAVNYYHFLYDAVARYGIFEEALPGETVDAIVVPHQARYQRSLLELAGIKGPFVQPQPGVTVVADRLLVPSTPNQDLDAPPWVVSWLRQRLPARPSDGAPRRLYLTRGDKPNTRRYVQEPQLWPWLEERGFERVDPGTCSVQEQIDMFHDAEVVVGPHGAALTNITFCRPGTKVLEMFAPRYVHLGLWTIAEAIGGIDYRYLVGDGDHSPGRPMVGNYDDVDIPASVVQQVIAEMIS
jgi:capsular polysaccharide biosynthesis protein